MKNRLILSLCGLCLICIFGSGNAFAADRYEMGPAGGRGGNLYTDFTYSNDKISQIVVWTGAVVDAIQLGRCRVDGTFYYSDKHGGSGGTPGYFNLAADEYVTAVRGYSNKTSRGAVLTAVAFTTNKRMSGWYGQPSGVSFELVVPDGFYITGLMGTSGGYLDSLGIYMTKLN